MSHRPGAFGARAHGERLERMAASKHFVDGRFQNTIPTASPLKKGQQSSTVFEFLFGGEKNRRPPAPLPVEDPRAPWSRPARGLRTTWLGHSTVLIEIDGARILTDPVFGERASPVTFAGPKRFHPTPVPFAELPAIDAVIVSHDHYDHLDYPTMLELARIDAPIFTSLGVGAHLEAWGIAPARVTELDWWQSALVPGRDVRVTAAPAQHFSGRSPTDRNRTFWSSWAIEGRDHRVFFSGDTGLTDEFEQIGAHFGGFDLVMLEVGAFHPSWGDIHLGPENALAAHRMLRGKTFLPVHWGTFDLGLHAWNAPAETLVARAPELGVHLVTPRLGRVVEPTRIELVDAWWREVGHAEKAPAREVPA